MKAIITRVRRLEQLQSEPGREPVRVVISGVGSPLNLEKSTCRWTLATNGLLTELVHLDGRRGDLTDEELDRWIASFPMERA
jgi:hypothetical protein